MTRLAVSMLLFTAAAAAQEAAEENPVRFTIGGRVLDESGAARPGLTVQAWDGERFLVAGVTGPKGRFLVAFREDVVSTREHPYGPLELRLVTTRWTMPRRAIRPGDRDLAITVRASVTRRALVKNADGDPFPGLVVRVRSGGRTVETTTVGDGSFRIHGLAPGAVVVQIIGDNFWIRKNKWADVITVPRVNHKAGRVRDRETGAPVAFAEIRHFERVVAVSEEDGSFQVPVLAGDPLPRLAIHADGYARVVMPASSWDVKLDRAALLRGHVVGAADMELAGARVVATGPHGQFVTWSNERGEFRFPVALHGMVDLTASHPEYRTSFVRVDAGADNRFTLRVTEGRRVEGTVENGSGAGLGAQVFCGDRFAYAGPDGGFVVEQATLEDVTVYAVAPGLRSMGTSLPASAGAASVTLALRAQLPFAGTVTSDIGKPVANAEVWFTHGNGKKRSVRTDAEGRFDFGAVPVGTFAVQVEAEGHATYLAHHWTLDGARAKIRMQTKLGAGTLRIGCDAGVLGRVTIRRRGEPALSRATALRGRDPAWFSHLPDGEYDVTAEFESYLPYTARVAIVNGATVEHTCKPVRGGGVTVVATPGASVIVQAVSGKRAPIAVLQLKNGTQTLERFGPGTYRFIGRAPGELIVVHEVELGPMTPPRKIDLRGGREARLVVIVVDAANEPVPGARIRLKTATAFEWNVTRGTTNLGQIKLNRLVGGRLEIYAKRGNRRGAGSVVVKPGGNHRVTVKIR